jgi:signal transduction histidine kinase
MSSPASIQADPAQLKQALLNIILNSIDAMPNGGILSISSTVVTNPPLGVIASEAKQSLPTVIPAKAGIYTIEISDTGCGIAPKDIPHIFEPFFTKKAKGTGLGLAITQGIIEKHGGTIKVESILNKGTIFKITLKAN